VTDDRAWRRSAGAGTAARAARPPGLLGRRSAGRSRRGLVVGGDHPGAQLRIGVVCRQSSEYRSTVSGSGSTVGVGGRATCSSPLGWRVLATPGVRRLRRVGRPVPDPLRGKWASGRRRPQTSTEEEKARTADDATAAPRPSGEGHHRQLGVSSYRATTTPATWSSAFEGGSVDAAHGGLRRAAAGQGAGSRVLTLGGGDVDTATPMGPMVFTVMAALAQMELEIKRERITDAVAERRPPARTSAAAVRPSPTPGSAMPSG